ncbi:IQ domain-containing protein C isoform X3 [Petromyzon marinus]|uniref:IQ domain-containing protein C isoform X2 n=1 Tax=Petromyzon marinus TaxID=7757 RepID=A0AAJ7TC46_PETMA|nr:IQ domain-containing protein C isoform X2 [Petromyzon marinus]
MENRNRRVRLVVKLQAAARGFLLRARLRALRGDYERVVSEVQGGLAGLSWVEGLVARPQFCSGDADPAAPHAPGDAPERDATRLPRGYKGEHADPELGEGAQGTAPQAQGSPLLTQRGPEEAAGTRDPGAAPGLEGLPLLQKPPPVEVNMLEEPPSLEEPTSLENLQELRSSLAMELLWLQQAIASRKNYLTLRGHVARPR